MSTPKTPKEIAQQPCHCASRPVDCFGGAYLRQNFYCRFESAQQREADLQADRDQLREQLADREKAQDILVRAIKENGHAALLAGQKAEELRAQRDNLAEALMGLLKDVRGSMSIDKIEAARTALAELNSTKQQIL